MLPWSKATPEGRIAKYGSEWAARLGDGELPKEEKVKDVELIRGIARCLAVAGYTAVKVGAPLSS